MRRILGTTNKIPEIFSIKKKLLDHFENSLKNEDSVMRVKKVILSIHCRFFNQSKAIESNEQERLRKAIPIIIDYFKQSIRMMKMLDLSRSRWVFLCSEFFSRQKTKPSLWRRNREGGKEILNKYIRIKFGHAFQSERGPTSPVKPLAWYFDYIFQMDIHWWSHLVPFDFHIHFNKIPFDCAVPEQLPWTYHRFYDFQKKTKN